MQMMSYQNPYIQPTQYTQPQYQQPQYTPYQHQYQQQQMPIQTQQSGLKKVYGPESALQIPMAPNSQSEPLFDYNGKVFYVVTSDAAGSKTLETFDYSPHKEQEPEKSDNSNFISRNEFSEYMAKTDARLEALSNGIYGQLSAAAESDGAANQPNKRNDRR